MKVIKYRLCLESPAIIRTLGTDPNSTKTVPYITGSSIRGAFVAKYIRKMQPVTMDLASDNVFRSVFLAKQIRYLNAYPTNKGDKGYRSLPYPLSLHREKDGEQNQRVDFAAALSDQELDDKKNDKQWKKDRDIFARFGYDEQLIVSEVQVKTGIAKHIAVDRKLRRPARDGGAIYHYQYIDAGQEFVGLILLDDADENNVQLLRELASGKNEKFHFGRAGHTGYGGNATLDMLGTTQELSTEIEFNSDAYDLSWQDEFEEQYENNRISIYLLADYVPIEGVNPLDALVRDVNVALGTNYELDKFHTFIATRIVSGYNSTWKLPLPQKLGLAMGGVIALRVDSSVEPVDLAVRLHHLEHEGVGDRLNEGFGRLSMQMIGYQMEWEYQENDRYHQDQGISENDPLVKNISSLVHASPMASRLAVQIIEQEVFDNLVKSVEELVDHSTNIPARSLLGRMREIIRSAPDREVIHAQLIRMGEDKKKPAYLGISACTVHGQDIFDRNLWLLINDLLTPRGKNEDSRIWKIVNFDDVVNKHGIVGLTDLESHMKNSESPDYALRYEKYFLDRLLSRLSLQSKH